MDPIEYPVISIHIQYSPLIYNGDLHAQDFGESYIFFNHSLGWHVPLAQVAHGDSMVSQAAAKWLSFLDGLMMLSWDARHIRQGSSSLSWTPSRRHQGSCLGKRTNEGYQISMAKKHCETWGLPNNHLFIVGRNRTSYHDPILTKNIYINRQIEPNHIPFGNGLPLPFVSHFCTDESRYEHMCVLLLFCVYI